MSQLDALATLAMRVQRLEKLLQAHHAAGVLPAHLTGQPCSMCERDGYWTAYPCSVWQPVTTSGTRRG